MKKQLQSLIERAFFAELDKKAEDKLLIIGYPRASEYLGDEDRKYIRGNVDSFTIGFRENNWVLKTWLAQRQLVVSFEELSEAIKMTCHFYNSWGTIYGEDGSMTVAEALTKLTEAGITAEFETGNWEWIKTIYGGAGAKSRASYSGFANPFVICRKGSVYVTAMGGKYMVTPSLYHYSYTFKEAVEAVCEHYARTLPPKE